jgi:hypothetical protein
MHIKKNTCIGSIILMVVIVVGAFWGGMKYSTSKLQGGFGNFNQATGTNRTGGMIGNRRGGMSGQVIAGEILSKDGESITVKTQDGSKIIFISTSTTFTKTISSSLDELQPATRVIANGTLNQDGSMSARSIQITTANNGGFNFGARPR